jgi:hypothetical protein
MKKLIIIVCIGLFLSGYCLGAVSPAKQARNDLDRVHLVAEDGSEVRLEAGRSTSDDIVDNQGHQYKKVVEIGGQSRAMGISLDDLVNKPVDKVYTLEDGRTLKCVNVGSDGRCSWRIINTKVGAGEPAGPTRTRMTVVPPTPKPPVKTSFWIQRSPRQKAGIGTGVAGVGVAVGSLLYTLIQGLRTKTRRRLMKVALDRIFGGSLEPLSKKEEAMISSLYRDLGIGAGGVALGGIGAGAGVCLYNKKQTAAAAA